LIERKTVVKKDY